MLMTRILLLVPAEDNLCDARSILAQTALTEYASKWWPDWRKNYRVLFIF